MRNDAINMEVNEGLLAFGAEEEGAVGVIVHEEVFGAGGGVEGGGEGIDPGVATGDWYRFFSRFLQDLWDKKVGR